VSARTFFVVSPLRRQSVENAHPARLAHYLNEEDKSPSDHLEIGKLLMFYKPKDAHAHFLQADSVRSGEHRLVFLCADLTSRLQPIAEGYLGIMSLYGIGVPLNNNTAWAHFMKGASNVRVGP